MRGKKNRKRWCAGHVGREHKTAAVDYATVKRHDKPRVDGMYKKWKLLVCTECGKELDRYFPWHDHWDMPANLRMRVPAWVLDP